MWRDGKYNEGRNGGQHMDMKSGAEATAGAISKFLHKKLPSSSNPSQNSLGSGGVETANGGAEGGTLGGDRNVVVHTASPAPALRKCPT